VADTQHPADFDPASWFENTEAFSDYVLPMAMTPVALPSKWS
jgi:hypothetical protein